MMLINNISTSNVTLQGSYTLSFNLIGYTENVDVFLKINDNNFVRILTNQAQGAKTYNGTNLSKGINNLILKINNSTEEYISEPFQIIVKENPRIANITTLYTDSNGKYRISFDLLGDDNFLYTIKLKIDDGTYNDIMFNQTKGNKVYEGTTTLGIHNISLQATDGFDIFTSPVYSLNVKNNIPKLTYILVSNETSSGSYTLNYATSDVENSTLTHKLKIDNGSFDTVSVSKDGNYYTYNGSGLSVGNHTLTIQISDGKDSIEKSVTVNVLAAPVTNKEKLHQSKIRYDFSYDSLKSLISNITEDRIFEFDLENPMLSKSMDLYSNAYSNFNQVSQQTIDAIGSKKVEVAKDDLKGQIDDVTGAVGDLEDTMNGVFKDGILSDSEKEAIRQNLNVLAKEKVDVDKDYETLYTNKDLLNPHKSNLKTSYDDFVGKYTTLINTINNVINKVGIVDNADKTNIDTAFTNWRKSLGEYTTSSLNAIDAIAKVKADNSADVIDKKYATIVLDPNTGIVSTVGRIQETVNNQGYTISRHESKITQLEGSITSSVSRDDVKSIIEQTPDSVQIGFNGINNNVVIDGGGLTVNSGSIACDCLTTPSGHEPVINLFTDLGYNCQIDARQTDGMSKGTAIRLKYNNYNYLYVNGNGMSLYKGGYQIVDIDGGSDGANFKTYGGTLKVRNSGIYHNYQGYDYKLTYDYELNWDNIKYKPSTFEPSSHSHSQYYGYGDSATFYSCMPTYHNSSGQYCGTVSQAWNYACCYNLRYNNYGTNVTYSLRNNNALDLFRNYSNISSNPTSLLNSTKDELGGTVCHEVFTVNERGESFVDGSAMTHYQGKALESLIAEVDALKIQVNQLMNK